MIDMIEENDKLYLEKKLFFDKNKVIEEKTKETDRRNVIFMSYNGEYYAKKLELAKYFYEKIEEAPDFDMKNHLTKKEFFTIMSIMGYFKIIKFIII